MLAAAGVPIGVVTGVTGRQVLDVTITGAANHAGTTPMDLRTDALAAAAEVVLTVEELPGRGLLRVATTGHVVARPNVRNVIAGRVSLGVDLRDEDAARLDATMAELDALLADHRRPSERHDRHHVGPANHARCRRSGHRRRRPDRRLRHRSGQRRSPKRRRP